MTEPDAPSFTKVSNPGETPIKLAGIGTIPPRGYLMVPSGYCRRLRGANPEVLLPAIVTMLAGDQRIIIGPDEAPGEPDGPTLDEQTAQMATVYEAQGHAPAVAAIMARAKAKAKAPTKP